MKNYLTSSELELAFEGADFILATQQQIARDFGRSGYDFTPHFDTEVIAYAELIEEIGHALAQVMQQGERTLLQLLYQIDVPQQDFLELTTEADFLPRLSTLILRREAMKVYLRRQFSQE